MSEKRQSRIIILNPKGAVLVARRSSVKDFGKLSIPGGKPNPGENNEEAAIREVAEETGFQFQLEQLSSFTESDFKGWLSFFYFVVVANSPPPAPNAEHSEFLWLSLAEIDQFADEFGFNHFVILKEFVEFLEK